MWAFLSARFRRWLLIAVGVPILAWVLDRLGAAIERRRRGSRAAGALRGASDQLRWWRSGRRRSGRRGRRPVRPGW
jgi:hypothetical protein